MQKFMRFAAGMALLHLTANIFMQYCQKTACVVK